MPKIIQPVQPEPFIVYSLKELEKLFPLSYEKAYERWRNSEYEYAGEFTRDESIESFKAIVDELGLTLNHWSFDSCRGDHFIRVSNSNDVEDLKGVRAFKYIVNNTSEKYSNSWNRRYKTIEERKKSWNKPWNTKDCPFTGVCFDETIMDYIKTATIKGATLEQALKEAWDELLRIYEAEIEYQLREEEFKERECDTEYTQDGHTH